MAFKYGVLLLFCLWQTTFAGESQYVCFSIIPEFQLQVTRSTLSYGKWISGYKNYEEIGGPSQGDTIQAYQRRTICSSGRQSSPSGAEGFVEFKDKDDRRIIVSWNRPWKDRDTDLSIGYDYDVFDVEERLVEEWYPRYYIKYVN